ncbi:hypothetical protein ACMYSQ_011212 [Aspergillus niger]
MGHPKRDMHARPTYMLLPADFAWLHHWLELDAPSARPGPAPQRSCGLSLSVVPFCWIPRTPNPRRTPAFRDFPCGWKLGDRHLIRPRRGGDKLVVLVGRYGENVIKNEGESVG